MRQHAPRSDSGGASTNTAAATPLADGGPTTAASEPVVAEPASPVDPALDPATPENAAALGELRAALAAEGRAQDTAGAAEPEYVPWADRLATSVPRADAPSRQIDDFTLLRFLIAREMDVTKAAAMVIGRVKWAAEVKLYGQPARSGGPGPWPGGIMAEWRPTAQSPRAKAAERVFYAGLGGALTLNGAPLMLERLGSADLVRGLPWRVRKR